jgi:hypothetical protein
MKKKGKFKQVAVMWIRDGVLINRMPINAVAFAYAYFLSAPAAEQDSLNINSLVNFAFAQSGISCLEKMTLWRSRQAATDLDLEAAVRLYNAVATEAACSASYFDGAIETLSWLKTCRASNFITSAVEQEVLDAWAYSPQGRQICSRSGPISEILGRRPNFCKGRDHFQHVSEWLTKTAYRPESELIKTIYYVADAVSEIKQGREFSAEFSIVPIGFAHHIDSAQVLAAASLLTASLEKLLASGVVSLDSFSSVAERLGLDERQLELPSAAALEASLRQAGAAHVVRNFDELRSSLDPQFATRRLYAGKTVKSRPMKPITMVVWALFMVTVFLFLSAIFGLATGRSRGTPQLIEYATSLIDSKRLRFVDDKGRQLDLSLREYSSGNSNRVYLDGKLLHPQSGSENLDLHCFPEKCLPSGAAFDGSELGIYSFGIVRLKDGRLFIAGGLPTKVSAWRVPGDTIETFKSNRTFFFDPGTGHYSKGPDLILPRRSHSMTLLHDGRVLISGGSSPQDILYLRQAEIFDPKLNLVMAAGSMNKRRRCHAVTELNNGKVLIVGGRTTRSFRDSDENLTSTVELYDPNTSTFTLVGQLHCARENPYVAPYGNSGAVIFAGSTDGLRDNSCDAFVVPVEYYDGTKTSVAKSVFHTPSLDELVYRLFNIGRKE